jgi:hypothetical protein
MKKVLRVFIVAVLAIMFANVATAQEKKNFTIDKLSVEGRVDFDYFNENNGHTSGIDGKFFNFEMKGSFLQDFSYRIRQRIDMYSGSSKTDYMIISYHANKNWSLTAGKMPLAIGGWEYDLPPIDVYFASLFWNNFACYDVGGQVEFHTNDGNHDIIFQVTNSPFTTDKFQNMYAYNLIWYGNMGPLTTSYSINMIAQNRGEYINYIALGNLFDFGKFDFYIDFMNRGFLNQSDFFLGDFTIIGEFKYAFTDKFTGIVKGGYDRNKHSYIDYDATPFPTAIPYDMVVAPGVEYVFGGLGFEAYPYKGNKNLRLHGLFALNELTQNIDDMLNPNSTNLSFQAQVGVTWRINFVK